MNREDIKNYAIFGKKTVDFITKDVIVKDIKAIILDLSLEINREYYLGYYKCLDDLKTILKAEMPKNKENTEFGNFIEKVFEKI